jgi:hypothetical protein
MKNELEHIVNKFFSSSNNQILHANLDSKAGEFCKTFDDLLRIMVAYDHPDFYAKKNNDVYIFEHFTIDASHTNKKGSLEQREIVRIETRTNEYYSGDHKGHISDKIENKSSFENFKNNLKTTYQKHISSIPSYMETLREIKVIDEDAKITSCFFIENTSPIGNYVRTGIKIKEFNLFTADFFIDILDDTKNNPDYIFYAQESKFAPILLLMSTKSLNAYKQHSEKITKESFIAFSPYTMTKRFFIERGDESTS